MLFDVSFDVSAPPEIVWTVMSDAERWHEWTPSVKSIRFLDNGPLAVGTRALVRQPRFPPAVWTVTTLESGASFTWRSGAPGMRVYARHAIEPAPGGSHVTLSLRYEGMLGIVLGRLTRGITNRYLGWEAAGLKQRSESLAASGERHERVETGEADE